MKARIQAAMSAVTEDMLTNTRWGLEYYLNVLWVTKSNILKFTEVNGFIKKLYQCLQFIQTNLCLIIF